MISTRPTRWWGIAIAGLLLPVNIAARAQENPNDSLKLPEQPAAWVNSSPISAATLQGKAAFLWFYEEGCPNCRAKWPSLIETSKKFAGQPIVFIAVNSGNPRESVEQYAREVKLTWPVIVDSNREFETACGVTEISLQNIHQVGLITPAGQFAPGSWSNPEESIERVLMGAKWNIDPTGIPEPLKQTWLAVEFGDFTSAATLVKKGMAAANPEIKAASVKLNDVVQKHAAAQIEAAKQAAAGGDKWQAYKTYQAAAERFAGYQLPPEVETAKKALSAEEDVKKQLAAAKAFEGIKRSAKTPSVNARRAALIRLKKLTEDFPGTDAAKEATSILAQFSEG